MNVKKVIGLSAIILLLTAGVYIGMFSPLMKVTSYNTPDAIDKSVLSMWVYSKNWDPVISEFHENHPNIDIDLRVFQTSEQLYKELVAAISANDAPNLAEVHSYYGVTKLVDMDGILSIQSYEPFQDISFLFEAYTSPFQWNEQLWALPAGASIPVIFYRPEMLSNQVAVSEGIRSWEDIIHVSASMIQATDKEGYSERWGLNIDDDLPWYLENIALQVGGIDQAYKMWDSWVHDYKIMKPLQHHLAISNFINEKSGIYIGSSKDLVTISKYIGGRFNYQIALLPGSQQYGVKPSVSGIVVANSAKEKKKAVTSFLEFLTKQNVQMNMKSTLGFIPTSIEVFESMDINSEDKYWRTVLEGSKHKISVPPSQNAEKRWTEQYVKIENLEIRD